MSSSSNRSIAEQPSRMIRLGRRVFVYAATACAAVILSARPATAQATYEYTGNPFTLFSCGPSVPGPGTILCSTPAPTNPNTSYTAADHVEVTLVLDNPLPTNLAYQDVRTFAGFSLTMNDGQHTVTNLDAVGMFAEVSTDADGDILQWRLVINTGGALNGGIASQNATFVTDSGTLACCDPTVSGDLARNSGVPGVWTSGTGTPTPEDLVSNLMIVVADPLLGLPGGQVNSLTDKLNNALASIQAGLNKQAANQLKAFISSVESLVKNGKMSSDAGTTLVNATNAILALL
jgi:hypothetical protein